LSNAWQFRDFANILALDVFPVPLGPLKRYAGAIFLVNNACLSVMDINFCPTSSSKLLCLYFDEKAYEYLAFIFH